MRHLRMNKQACFSKEIYHKKYFLFIDHSVFALVCHVFSMFSAKPFLCRCSQSLAGNLLAILVALNPLSIWSTSHGEKSCMEELQLWALNVTKTFLPVTFYRGTCARHCEL